MKYRKVIGWILFALGIPLCLIFPALSKVLIGNMAIGIFIAALIIGGGWFLAHPKKKNEKS